MFALLHIAAQPTMYRRQPLELKGIIRTDFLLPNVGPQNYFFETCSTDGFCLVCPNHQQHYTQVNYNYHNKKILSLTCRESRRTPPKTRAVPMTLSDFLLMERPSRSAAHKPPAGPPGGLSAEHPKPNKPIPSAHQPRTGNLIIMTWNTDKQIRSKIHALMNHAREHSIDIIGLQEAESLHAGAEDAIEANGYYLYRHGKVALLVSTQTATKITNACDVWRSESYNSLSITLTTRRGSILIVVAYLPTGVDNMTQEEKLAVTNQHLEINSRATQYEHAIILMDGNETTHRNGRIHTKCTQRPLSALWPQPPPHTHPTYTPPDSELVREGTGDHPPSPPPLTTRPSSGNPPNRPR
jgi:hypothetical protein